MLSDERLAEIKKREQAALAGPWKAPRLSEEDYEMGEPIAVVDTEDYLMAECHNEENQAFIAHARTDIPDLLADAAEARTVMREALAALEAMLLACPVKEGGTTHRMAREAIAKLEAAVGQP